MSGRSQPLTARLARFAALAGVCAFLPAVALAAEPGTTPLEQAAGAAASEVAGKPVLVRCHDAASWAATTTARGIPSDTEAFVVFGGTVAEVSPRTCAALDDVWIASPPACLRYAPYTVTVRRMEWVSVKRRVRVRVAGNLVWRVRTVRVRQLVTRKVTRERSEPAHCLTQSDHAEALWTLAHEAWHLAGVRDEATAECYGLQRVAQIGTHLGASSPTALASLAWDRYQRNRPGTALWSAECRPGGSLDLTPAEPSWP